MPITPSTVNFTYKKYDTIPPAITLNFDVSPVPPVAYNVPSYLEVYDITNTNLKVRISAGANDATQGSYSDIITLKYFNEISYKLVDIGSFVVNTTIEGTVLLVVSPTSADFIFQIGKATPIDKVITVTSENNWTVSKTQAWVSLSATSGSNNGVFQIGVLTTGLTAGVYSDIVSIDDGVTIKTIAVTITVTNSNTETDYLYSDISVLNFGFTINSIIPPNQNVVLNSSAAWTATASETWVNLPISSGGSGSSIVEIGLQLISGLTIGEHIATITFNTGDINKVVTIHLTIYNFITELLDNNILYFADDETNLIKIKSGRLDTFMQLQLSTLYKSISYFLEAEIPIFKGGAQKRIGVEPKKIIGLQNFNEIAEASLFQSYLPISFNITINELHFFTKALQSTQTLNGIRFIKGEKPLNNWLTENPKQRFLTKNGVLYFSVLTEGVAATKIEITGAQTKTYNFTSITAEYLTGVIFLNDLGYLKEGDVVYVDLLGNTIEVNIIAETTQQTLVFWENKWGFWDCSEFTGKVIITDNYTRKTATVRKSELYTETKIIDVTKPMDIKVSTGDLHTNENVTALDNLLEAKNVYLKTNNTVFKVNPTSKKLIKYETDIELREYNLTFKNVIE